MHGYPTHCGIHVQCVCVCVCVCVCARIVLVCVHEWVSEGVNTGGGEGRKNNGPLKKERRQCIEYQCVVCALSQLKESSSGSEFASE